MSVCVREREREKKFVCKGVAGGTGRQMDRLTVRQMDRQTDRQMLAKRTEKQMDRQTASVVELKKGISKLLYNGQMLLDH